MAQYPSDAEKGKRIAIFVGRGRLPKEVTLNLQAAGRSPLLVGIEGETDPWLEAHPYKLFPWGKVGAFFSYLNKNGIEEVVMVGGVTRPKVEIHKMDLGALIALPQILSFMIGGDNSLLTGLIKLFNKKGMDIVGAHEVMPELVAPAGVITKNKPSKTAMKNLAKAYEACQTLGTLDIGQGAVAVGGRVVAVEGIEGTDSMLSRVAELRTVGRLTESGKHGVLVKAAKPHQDLRVDMPAIGPDTVRNAINAGLQGVAVESGRSIILSREETIALAQEAGLFIYGITPSEVDAT